MKPTILALGFTDDSGRFVVTDVLCSEFPEMTHEEKSHLSWKLCKWASGFRRDADTTKPIVTHLCN